MNSFTTFQYAVFFDTNKMHFETETTIAFFIGKYF